MASIKAPGNIYIDPAYTSQEAVNALGGISPITGEALIFGSTLDDLATGANAFAPNGMKKWFTVEGTTVFAADGCTMYVSNYTFDNESFYGNGTYGLYFIGSSANYLYGLPKAAGTYDLENGINITVENSLIHYTLAPGALLGSIAINGDVNVQINGSTIGALVIGGGTSYQQYGTINGDITFSVTDTAVTGGGFHIHSGKLFNSENADELAVVSGTVSNVTVYSSFSGIHTVSDNANRTVSADYDVVISGSSFGDEINIGYFSNLDDWTGSYVLTVAGSTAASIRGNGDAAGLPDVEHFDLVIGASGTRTVTGVIDRFKTITIDAGAKVQADSISGATLVNLSQGAEVSVGQITGIGMLSITGDYTAGNNTIISGLGSFSVSNIAAVRLNGTEIEYGYMPGQYNFVGDKLVLVTRTLTDVYLNSTYTAATTGTSY